MCTRGEYPAIVPPLERDDFSSSRHPALSFFLFEHDLFGKPVPTFPDHALIEFRDGYGSRDGDLTEAARARPKVLPLSAARLLSPSRGRLVGCTKARSCGPLFGTRRMGLSRRSCCSCRSFATRRWLGPSSWFRASSHAARRVWRCRSARAAAGLESSGRIPMEARIAKHG